jgi:hypothetical protein
MTYSLDSDLEVMRPKKGRGLQKVLVNYNDLKGIPFFANDASRDLVLNAGVLMPETLALHPMWLCHVSTTLETLFGSDTFIGVRDILMFRILKFLLLHLLLHLLLLLLLWRRGALAQVTVIGTVIV